MTTAFVFPGQGSQAVGMGAELLANFAAAREVLQEVDDALGVKLSAIIAAGPEADLTLTENAQPAIMAISLAVFRVMQQQMGIRLGLAVAETPSPHRGEAGRGADLDSVLCGSPPPNLPPMGGGTSASCVAGHSLGEYSALTAAGALTITECAKLLQIRGRAMQAAVPAGKGGMVAVIGPEMPAVEAIVEEARKRAPGEVIEIANHNSSNQIVLSGTAKGMEVAIEVAKEMGAKRALPLPVSAPFHCSLMAPAAQAMEKALAACEMCAPAVPLVANVTAAYVRDVATIKSLLVQQVTGTVRWVDSILAMQAVGVTRMVEIGHGNVLTGLIKRIAPDIALVNIATPADMDSFAKVA